MVFPLAVDDIEQDVALEPAQGLRAEQGFLLLVALLDLFDQRVRQLIVIEAREVDARRLSGRIRTDSGLRWQIA